MNERTAVEDRDRQRRQQAADTVANLVDRTHSWNDLNVPLVVVDVQGNTLGRLRFRFCSQQECAYELVATT